jgi:hypothetical protein
VNNKCTSGLVCTGGQCIAAPGSPCQGDTSCSFGERCVSGACTGPTFQGACHGDGDCGNGLHCANGICAVNPGAYCTSDAACSGLSCIRGRCEAPSGAPCQGDTECAGGNRCVSGSCKGPVAPGNFCQADNQCPVGSFCIDKLCKRPCDFDSECVAEDRCVGGFCTPPAVCTDTNTVAPAAAPATGNGDTVCATATCTVNGEPTGQRPSTGTTPPASGCASDETCSAGSCTQNPRSCTSSADCNPGDTCGGGACQNVPGACTSNEDCALGDVCSGGWCGHACHVTQAGLEQPSVVQGCVPGQACTNGVCADRCHLDSDCGTGYACQAGSCVPSLDGAQNRVRPAADGANGDATAGGCSVASTGGSQPAAAGLPMLLFAGLFVLGARRRRR